MQTKGVNCPHICMKCVNELYQGNGLHSNRLCKEGRGGVFVVLLVACCRVIGRLQGAVS